MKRYLLSRKANRDDRHVQSTSRPNQNFRVTVQAEIHTHNLLFLLLKNLYNYIYLLGYIIMIYYISYILMFLVSDMFLPIR